MKILYLLVKVPLRPAFQKLLPKAFYNRLKMTILGWEFIDKHAAHDQFGPAFILVTTSMNELWCADPVMAQSILARRKDFVSLPMTRKVMGFLGGNVLTVSMIIFECCIFFRNVSETSLLTLLPGVVE
jgi:hypothetical protein